MKEFKVSPPAAATTAASSHQDGNTVSMFWCLKCHFSSDDRSEFFFFFQYLQLLIKFKLHSLIFSLLYTDLNQLWSHLTLHVAARFSSEDGCVFLNSTCVCVRVWGFLALSCERMLNSCVSPCGWRGLWEDCWSSVWCVHGLLLFRFILFPNLLWEKKGKRVIKN